ncbi:MAG TPA: BrxA/BrxB family bacilliredoxin [Bryobacteraceae bacterium]|jgi:putative YphP/YqiW family bacilliredoxin|nr:BrxA/BrxB family bacilliredoxin [Bryobacteraceae bacterium]
MQTFVKPQQYPEALIAPMREDLRRFGVEEARTAEQVDALLSPGSGTVMIVTNSVCGCAAGKARPGVGMALSHSVRPGKAASVFAGADIEAVARVRELLPGIPPSSPSVALFQDGKPVFVLHRREIESREAADIAAVLKQAFEQYCA